MTTYRCFLKHNSSGEPLPARQTIFKATSKENVHLTNLVNTPKGYLAIVHSQEDVEKLLSPRLTKALNEVKMTPIPPKDLTEKRTLFVRGIEPSLGKLPAPELLEQFQFSNSNLKIENIIKMPNRDRYLKVQFNDYESAQTALKNGMLLNYQRIPPSNIAPQTIATVSTCYRCYAINQHATKDCPTPNAIKCSNCASDQHTYKNCPEPNKNTCVNCTTKKLPNNHHTLAMSCPLRKTAIQTKKKDLQAKRNTTQPGAYSNALRQGLLPTPAPQPTPLMSITNARPPPPPSSSPSPPILNPPNRGVAPDKDIFKMTLLVIDAHIAAPTHPTKSYADILRESFIENYGVDVTVPNHTHSKQIIQDLLDKRSTEPPKSTTDDPAKTNKEGEPTYTQVDQIVGVLASQSSQSQSSEHNTIRNVQGRVEQARKRFETQSVSPRSRSSSRSSSTSSRDSSPNNNSHYQDTICDTPTNGKDWILKRSKKRKRNHNKSQTENQETPENKRRP